MIDQTPLDTTPNTPLDAIKAAYLRAHDLNNAAVDTLLAQGFTEDDETVGRLESVERSLALLVCEQLGLDAPDRNWVPIRSEVPQLYRYDNGEPIVVPIGLGTGVSIEVWPRFDTKEDVESLLGYAVEYAFSSTVRAEKAAAEAAADEQHSNQRKGSAADAAAAYIARTDAGRSTIL